jgi:hypothetical protein
MNTSIYTINKGINKSIEFKGFRAQYIWYLGGGFLMLLLLFAVLYICGVHPFICLGIILAAGICWALCVGRLSHKYGEYGLMKKMAKKGVPDIIKSGSRKIFQKQNLLKAKR